MGLAARMGLVFAMIALLAGAQLLEKEFKARRKAAQEQVRASPPAALYADILAPLEDANLPRRPRPAAHAPASAGPVSGGPSGATNAQSGPSGERSYTVQSGDTLSKIARKVYGAESAWPAILVRNRATIKDEASLKPGTVLVIPPKKAP